MNKAKYSSIRIETSRPYWKACFMYDRNKILTL